MLTWEREAVQLRQRLLCAGEWLPETGWPAVDDHALLAALPRWLLLSLSGVHDARGLAHVNLAEALLRYQQGEPPVLAVRMQEMFGEQQTPRVAEGCVAAVARPPAAANHP